MIIITQSTMFSAKQRHQSVYWMTEYGKNV